MFAATDVIFFTSLVFLSPEYEARGRSGVVMIPLITI